MVGSGRIDGNASIMADAFIEGISKNENQIKKVQLCQMNIKPCLSCKYCATHIGECITKDDIQELYNDLFETDLIVFATPIYYYGFTAQMKTFIDRFYLYQKKKFYVSSFVLLTVYAGKDETIANLIKDHYLAFTKYLGWKNEGIIDIGGVSKKGAIIENPKLKLIKELGVKLS